MGRSTRTRTAARTSPSRCAASALFGTSERCVASGSVASNVDRINPVVGVAVVARRVANRRSRLPPSWRIVFAPLHREQYLERAGQARGENPRSPTGHRSSAFDRHLQVRPALLEQPRGPGEEGRGFREERRTALRWRIEHDTRREGRPNDARRCRPDASCSTRATPKQAPELPGRRIRRERQARDRNSPSVYECPRGTDHRWSYLVEIAVAQQKEG